ncbi:hypothetical protein ACIPSE_14945 [Streptomyces sp. NPDC090106]|uniref:hypothetical protein n=1 Tax=Streptomyces sp. NPDC090106 TaxID=3365946 RepID=UPI003827509D
MPLFGSPKSNDRELTQRMITDITVDLKAGRNDDFTVVVAGSLFETANAQGLADDCGQDDAYPPPGHGYSRRR